jgi:hypothetical protein
MAPSARSLRSSEDRATALVAVLPDMVQHGVWEALGTRLAAGAVEIVAATVTRVRPDDVIRLYAGNHHDRVASRRPESTNLSIELFSLDATVPVLLRTGLPGVDLVDLITKWKGDSAHGRRRLGDLRSVAPAADRCLSLLHAPDDRSALRHDGRVLFGPIFDRLIEERPDRPIDVAAIARVRHYCPPAQEVHPWDIVFRSIVRGLTLLGVDARVEPSAETAAAAVELESTRRAVASERPEKTRSTVIAALRDANAVVSGLDPPVIRRVAGDALIEAQGETLDHRRRELRRAIELLTRPDLFCGPLADHVEETLLSNHLVLDAWEQHRLKSAIVFLGEGRS